MNKSYYKNGVYIDITTNNTYTPKRCCEICGSPHCLTVHHRLPQNKCIRDLKTRVKTPSTWDQEFINKNQKLYTVCLTCHANIHNGGDRFWQKYNLNKEEFIL